MDELLIFMRTLCYNLSSLWHKRNMNRSRHAFFPLLLLCHLLPFNRFFCPPPAIHRFGVGQFFREWAGCCKDADPHGWREGINSDLPPGYCCCWVNGDLSGQSLIVSVSCCRRWWHRKQPSSRRRATWWIRPMEVVSPPISRTGFNYLNVGLFYLVFRPCKYWAWFKIGKVKYFELNRLFFLSGHFFFPWPGSAGGGWSGNTEQDGSSHHHHEHHPKAGSAEGEEGKRGVGLSEGLIWRVWTVWGDIPSSSLFWKKKKEKSPGENAPSERQVSPGKRYRAALLRSRFADTILKAREKALLDKVCPPMTLPLWI